MEVSRYVAYTYYMRNVLNILYQTAKSSFKLRNESSYLGIFWYLLGPLLTFGILYYVFSGRLGSGVGDYPLYLLSGIVVWNFYSAGSSRSLTAIMGNAGIIKALPVRRDAIVISGMIDAFVSHLFEIAILLAFCAILGTLTPIALLFSAVLLLQFLFALGTGFLLSALYVFFGDLGQIWSVLTKAWWFATPIFYTLSEGGPGKTLSMFNPMYHSIELSRNLLVYGILPPLSSWVILALFSVLTLVLGYAVFHKLSPRFAEFI